MSVSVVSITDPIAGTNKKTKYVHRPEKYLDYYLKHIDLTAGNFVICVNGSDPIPVESLGSFAISDSDIIGICAKTEFTVAGFVAQTLATAILNEGFITAGYAALYSAFYVGTLVGVGYVSSMIMSSLGPEINQNKTPKEDSYGWDRTGNTYQEGTSIPVILGKNRVYGQIIDSYIDMVGNSDRINFLIGICDHEVDAITDCLINDSEYDTFNGASFEYDLGGVDGAVLGGFGDTYTEYPLNTRLLNSTHSATVTTGALVEEINCFFTYPQGLFHVNPEDGWYSARQNKVKVQVRISGADTWVDYNFSFWAKNTGVVRGVRSITGLSPNTYDVRVKRRTDEVDKSNEKNVCHITSIQAVVPDTGQLHPGLAKYAVSVIATDQISGSAPRISCLPDLQTVRVWDESLSTPAWADKRATNPAWMCWHILYKYGRKKITQIVWEDFKAWGDYGDKLIDGDYRFDSNIVIGDGSIEGKLQEIAALGRGRIIRRGVRYGVFCDMPETQVSHVFSAGNILTDSYSMTYLPVIDAANEIEIEYTDVDTESREVITVEADDKGAITKRSKISVDATISSEEATRQAIFSMNVTTLLRRVPSWKAYKDSFACLVGDLVYFQHFATDQESRIGGRIIAAGNDDGDGNPYVQFDRDMTVVSSVAYGFVVRLEDDEIVEKTITSVSTTSDTFVITTAWDTVPDVTELPPYIFGETYKKTYRITEITRASDRTRAITAIEYVPEIYTNNDGFLITGLTDTIEALKAINVILDENLIWNGQDFVSDLNVSWTPNNDDTASRKWYENRYTQEWTVWIEDVTPVPDWVTGTAYVVGDIIVESSINYVCLIAHTSGTFATDLASGDWETAGDSSAEIVRAGSVVGNSFIIPNTMLHIGDTYKIYINPIDQGAVDLTTNIATTALLGKYADPDDVTDLAAEWKADIRSVRLTWTANTDLDLLYYEIRDGSSWATADPVTVIAGTTFDAPVLETDETPKTYLIKAVDTTYNESGAADSVAVTVYPSQSPTLGATFGDGSAGTGNITVPGTGSNPIDETGSVPAIGGDTIGGIVNASDGGSYLSLVGSKLVFNGKSLFSSTANGVFVGLDASDSKYKVNIGTTSKFFKWDANDLSWAGTETSLTAAGLFTATNAVIKGDITATTGHFTNVTLGETGVASGILTFQLNAGNGDTYLNYGKTDFTNTDAGFILGIDDSDGDKAKFYLGNSTSNMYWDGTELVHTKGTLVETIIQMHTSVAALTTHADAGDGTTSSAGMKITHEGLFGFGASQTTANANIRILSDGTAYFADAVLIDGVLSSSNFTATTGMQIDLENATITVRKEGGLVIDAAGGMKIEDGGDITLTGGTSGWGSIIFEWGSSPNCSIDLSYMNSLPTLFIAPVSESFTRLSLGKANNTLGYDPKFRSMDFICGPLNTDYSYSYLNLEYDDLTNNGVTHYLTLQNSRSEFKCKNENFPSYISSVGAAISEGKFAIESAEHGDGGTATAVLVTTLCEFKRNEDSSGVKTGYEINYNFPLSLKYGATLNLDTYFLLGSDSDDGNKFKLSVGDTLGTDDVIEIDSAKNIGLLGPVTLGSIAAATTDTDKFLVSDSGVVKYRTGSEVLDDIEDDRIVKAWVNYNGELAAASMIKDDLNISSITDVESGQQRLYFATAMLVTNYCVVVTVGSKDTDDATRIGAVHRNNAGDIQKFTTYVSILTGRSSSDIVTDNEDVNVVIFGG